MPSDILTPKMVINVNGNMTFSLALQISFSSICTWDEISGRIYFTTSTLLLQAIPGVPKIKEGYNPATWMLEVSTSGAETQLNVDFAEIFANSDLYR